MPADLQFWHPDHLADPKGKLQSRHVNTLNTPIASSSWLDDGAAIADVYELVFTKTGGNVTATIETLIGEAKNPYREMGSPKAVVADGVTVNRDLVPGIGLVVSASVDTGWKARVAVFNYLEDDGSFEAFFGSGIVEAGTATSAKKVSVKNVGDSAAAQTKAYVLPYFYPTGASRLTFLKSVKPHSSPNRHKYAQTGDLVVTFADWKWNAGVGHYTADVYVGGVKAIEDAILDGSTLYQWGSGNGYDDGADKFRGLGLVFADTVQDPSAQTFTIKVIADYTPVEYAPDNSGAPGTFANQDLTLTQSGQPSGTILAGGAVPIWFRINVPEALGPGDLRKVDYRLRGLTV